MPNQHLCARCFFLFRDLFSNQTAPILPMHCNISSHTKARFVGTSLAEMARLATGRGLACRATLSPGLLLPMFGCLVFLVVDRAERHDRACPAGRPCAKHDEHM